MDDDQKPATKQDIENLRAELRTQIKQESDMLRSEFHHAYDDLKESIRDVQTELLKAF